MSVVVLVISIRSATGAFDTLPSAGARRYGSLDADSLSGENRSLSLTLEASVSYADEFGNVRLG